MTKPSNLGVRPCAHVLSGDASAVVRVELKALVEGLFAPGVLPTVDLCPLCAGTFHGLIDQATKVR